ncbi:hypothetical protein LOAG_18604 [Loa loa]|uniref:Uncharacterized protein n=1 Tax=Loa loa TaxID=7209 RepID=A0A1S0UEN3_LOALO|nr:hypothetical protein LOAG_18604 [Loa loa]EJD74023.1 hypothetical protein LOAG_18604 [Loa loa]
MFVYIHINSNCFKFNFILAPIQVVIPNLWKDLNIGQIQKNDELKAALEMMTNENKRLDEIIKQMMKEITFLRESLLSTVMKLASTVVAGTATTSPSDGQGKLTSITVTSPTTGKSGGGISVGSTITGISGDIKTSAATGTSRVSSPATSGAGGVKSSAATGTSRVSSPATSGAGGVKTATGESRTTSPISGGASSIKTSIPSDVSGAQTPISVAADGILSHTGADIEVEKYLSAMLAEGGPTAEVKGSDGVTFAADGGIKEFSLYCPGASSGGLTSAYMTSSSPGTGKAKNISFAFGNTADQLGQSGRPDSPGGGSSGGTRSVSAAGGGRGRAGSVYL